MKTLLDVQEAFEFRANYIVTDKGWHISYPVLETVNDVIDSQLCYPAYCGEGIQ